MEKELAELLLQKLSVLHHTLETWEPPRQQHPQREAGYRQALGDVRLSDDFQAVLVCARELRRSLANQKVGT
jgi:hypothetical protein